MPIRKKIMNEESYEGIPRNKIPWGPKINYEKCVSCGKCVDYCKLGVYEFEEKEGKKKLIVKYPNNCVVLCAGCEEQCPAEAITHPSKKKTIRTIKKLKETHN